MMEEKQSLWCSLPLFIPRPEVRERSSPERRQCRLQGNAALRLNLSVPYLLPFLDLSLPSKETGTEGQRCVSAKLNGASPFYISVKRKEELLTLAFQTFTTHNDDLVRSQQGFPFLTFFPSPRSRDMNRNCLEEGSAK